MGQKFQIQIQKTKPTRLELDILINGKEGAIETSEYDRFAMHRWEQLVIDFFRGKKRKWQYDGGKFDIPDPDNTDKFQKVLPGTSPKELFKAGELTESERQIGYGVPYDGVTIREISWRQLCRELMNYLIPNKVKNRDGRPYNSKLRGDCIQILKELKKC